MPEKLSHYIGECIYCGAKEPNIKLTDEHVVPLGLNGNIILEKASCTACAAITGAIEQFCLHEMLIEVRTHLNMKTRRPKDRPKSFFAYLRTTDGEERASLSIAEDPIVMRLPNLAEPAILTGTTNNGQFPHVHPIFWTFIAASNEAQAETAKKLEGKDLSYSPDKFCLMLAKIAYGSAIYWRGYQTFESNLPDLIRSRSNDISDYVGGCPAPEGRDRTSLHHLHIRTHKDTIIVELCLFARLGAPYYQVVVGKPKTMPLRDSAPTI